MKRILSVLLALVMVIGMLPMTMLTASAADTTATLSFANKAQRTSFSSTSQVWEQNGITFTNNKAASTNAVADYAAPVRLYAGSEVIVACAGMKTIVFDCNSGSYATAMKNSIGTVSGATVTVSSDKVTVTFASAVDSFTVAKLTAQVRMDSISVTCEVASVCDHSGDKLTVVTTPATCTEKGSTDTTCSCGKYSTSVAIPALGHNYVDGICQNCQGELPASVAGRYYIAGLRTKEGSTYHYMTNDLGEATTQRYQSVDTLSTELPESINSYVANQVFVLVQNANTGKYTIYAESVEGDKYLGWTSSNEGRLVAEASALALDVDANEDGTYYVHFDGGSDERYLALNNSVEYNYFAFYPFSSAAPKLHLVPVSEDATDCEHANTTVINGVDATCTEGGYSGDTVCADCGAVIAKGADTEAAGHNYGEWVETTPATCTEDGEKTQSCTACDDTITETISASGHSYEDGKCLACGADECAHEDTSSFDTVPATCTEVGYTAGVYCNDCEKYISGHEEIPSLGHDWGDWEETTAPGCETNGVETSTCANCGETKTQAITATGHNYIDGTCENCGEAEPVIPSEATITFDDKAKRTEYSTSIQVWEENDITVTNNKATSTSNVGDYVKPARFYKNSTVTIEYPGITKIVFNCNSNDYATALKASISNGTATVNGSVVTVELAEAADSYTTGGMSAQVRVDSITVYTSKACDHNWEVIGTTAPTCTEAGATISKCALCQEQKSDAIAALGHTYTFAETAVSCSVCSESINKSNIGDLPKAASTTPYYIEGVVTFVDGRNVYIEDSTGGICVYYANGEQKDAAIGDIIRVCDSLTVYYGLVETTETLYAETQKVSTGNKLPCKATTVTDLVVDFAGNKALMSTRVALTKVTVTEVGTYNTGYKNVDYTVSDGTNTIKLYRAPAASADTVLKVGDVVNVIGVVSSHDGYQLRVVAESDITKVPTVALTHISLDPNKDALGFKAAATNLPNGAELGIRLWVYDNNVITKTVAKENISLRLKNIMAYRAGQTVIHAQAVVILDGEVIAESQEVTTSMKDTIQAVNKMDGLSATQKAAVYGLYEKYETVMAGWLGETNNIKDWAPVVTETPAAPQGTEE